MFGARERDTTVSLTAVPDERWRVRRKRDGVCVWERKKERREKHTKQKQNRKKKGGKKWKKKYITVTAPLYPFSPLQSERPSRLDRRLGLSLSMLSPPHPRNTYQRATVSVGAAEIRTRRSAATSGQPEYPRTVISRAWLRRRLTVMIATATIWP